jgi:negative regulator of sigma E activity
MPAMAKTRRISSSQRNASFVGTDFSYADLDNRDIEDSTKKKLPDEAVGGQSCYVVEVVPTDPQSQYGRVQLWIAKQTWLPLRIRFWGKSGTEIKRFTTQEVKKVQDRWLITESKMVDLKREHTTVFKVVEVTLRKDIDLEQFTVRALERG